LRKRDRDGEQVGAGGEIEDALVDSVGVIASSSGGGGHGGVVIGHAIAGRAVGHDVKDGVAGADGGIINIGNAAGDADAGEVRIDDAIGADDISGGELGRLPRTDGVLRRPGGQIGGEQRQVR